MKNLFLSILLLIMITNQTCLKTEEECKKTEAPEINVGLIFSGTINIQDNSGKDITADFVDTGLDMIYYKVYCSGKNNGPFTSEFSINKDGTLYKKSIGYWSFRMDNKQDYIRVSFFIAGEDIGQTYNVTYDQLKAFDGGKPILKFSLIVTFNGYYFLTESLVLAIS